MIDEQLFTDLKDLYKENVELFKQQNGGFLVEKVRPLLEDDLDKIFDSEEIIDKKYINKHFVNFTINPQITEFIKGYTTRIEISPDISWECKK